MINLLCVLSKFILYYGLPWKQQYFIKPKCVYFLRTFVSNLLDLSEQFGTHEELS